MQKFIDDDGGYLHWLNANPMGFVVNCERSPRASYLILHHTTCGTIRGVPARGKRWTADYMKVCSLSKVELESWARIEVGGEVSPCGLCNP
ncbi:MAG: hypothetical protein ISS52_06990 [Dehalococcoidia bacterium]|nr:hypothetical protein [Dehalococcoidia bacterium]